MPAFRPASSLTATRLTHTHDQCLGRSAHVRMEHQIDVHRLINRGRVIHVQLYREVLVRIDRDGDRELIHRYVLSTTASRSVNAVRSCSDNWIHFRNGDQRQEDDILVDDPELEIRTTANDFSIAGYVRRVLVGTQHTN